MKNGKPNIFVIQAEGRAGDRNYAPTDDLEPYCLRDDKTYSQRAYQGILGYRSPEN